VSQPLPCTASELAREYLRLHLAEQIGPVTLGKLIQQFGSVSAIMNASVAELARVDGVGRTRAEAVFSARKSDTLDHELELAAEQNVRVICWEDEEYPTQLRHVSDPPVCLYVRGRLEPQDAVALAVVGSRRCSHYGAEQSRRFGWLLGGAGYTVVSGLARGIDATAHRGALEAGGRTVAVLGNGLSSVYPPEHAGLAANICERGAVISELPMLTGPDAHHFPRRNRIIVGMGLGVLVVEAARNSGALISARLASEYNREVFAVPGRVDSPQSYGTNQLIRDGGAKLVTDLEDIVTELGDVGRVMSPKPAPGQPAPAEPSSFGPQPPLSEAERGILEHLSHEPTDLGLLADQLKLGIGELISGLTMLSVKGLVKRLPGDRYVRAYRP
jgi:DNA processing protein